MAGEMEHGGRHDLANRDEYCAYIAAQPNGRATALTELIDGLLVEGSFTADSQLSASVTEETFHYRRRFSYLESAVGAPAGTIATTAITIDYAANRTLGEHRYGIAISWLVTSLVESKITGPLTAGYSITAYDNGPVYGFVSEPDLLVERELLPRGVRLPYSFSERRLTDYDYISLAGQLSVIHELDTAPWRDNGQPLVGGHE